MAILGSGRENPQSVKTRVARIKTQVTKANAEAFLCRMASKTIIAIELPANMQTNASNSGRHAKIATIKTSGKRTQALGPAEVSTSSNFVTVVGDAYGFVWQGFIVPSFKLEWHGE